MLFTVGAEAVNFGQKFFTKAKIQRCNLQKFILFDKIQTLFQAIHHRWVELDGNVSICRMNVGQFFCFADVDFYILLSVVDADDHAFVYRDTRADEGFATLLHCRERIAGRFAAFYGDEDAITQFGYVG